MKPHHLLLLASIAAVAVSAISAGAAFANDRYATPPPVVMSPDLTAPWVTQLQGVPAARRLYAAPQQQTQIRTTPVKRQKVQARRVESNTTYQEVAYQRPEASPSIVQQKPRSREMDPKFLPQIVDYSGEHKPGTIVIDTAQKYLYLVEDNGQARRYGVGVGKQGFSWKGTQTISRKAEWPSWHPPKEMIAREAKKGRILPVSMEGGLDNPLGARALYLGSTLYRIHGTNAPWTIGTSASSGCIRMRNEDVTDLYERVNVGAKVVVR